MSDAKNDTAPRWRERGLFAYLALALGLEAVLLLPFLLGKHAFAFYDIGSDTFLQFYPLQIAIATQLKELHAVSWSFDFGLGSFIGSLFDPMLLVTGWLPESWQLATRLPMFALRVLLGGGFFYQYLRLIGFEMRFALLGGLAYAFSTYGILNAQWEVMHGTEFVQFAVFLYVLERYLRGGSRGWAVAAGIIVGLGHAMGLYMFGLFGLVYGLARLVATRSDERPRLFATFARFAGWCAVGLAIAGPLLFPAVYYLLASPRVSGDYSLMHAVLSQILHFNDFSTIATQISGLLGKDLLGTNLNFKGPGNYFEAPGFYVGVLPLVCIPQLLGPHASTRERRFCVAALVLVALYLLLPALRSAVYGFGDTTFRFSTLWVSSLLLLVGLAGLRRAVLSGPWFAGTAIGFAAIAAIVGTAWLAFRNAVDVHHAVLAVFFAGVYAIYLVRMRSAQIRALAPLVVVFVCELGLFAASPLLERNPIRADGANANGVRYEDGTEKAVASLRTNDPPTADFYRIEKTYYSVFLDDSLIQKYSGTASYAFHGAAITRFVDKMQLKRALPSANYINSMIERRDVLDLLGVRYFLSRDHSPEAWRDVSLLTNVAGVTVYRNNSAHPFGQFYDTFAPEAEADAMPVPQRDSFLLGHLLVDDPAIVRAALAQMQTAAAAPENRSVRIGKAHDNHLSGSVQTPNASALLLAMPFDKGWSATIDGRAVDLFRADYGLTALLVPAGRHILELDYRPPGRIAGLWASSLGVVLLALMAIVDRRTRKKRVLSASGLSAAAA
ncbi:MAG TPA: YfhO family protein [Rudaea sp.]